MGRVSGGTCAGAREQAGYMARRSRTKDKPAAVKDDTRARENLPWPFVYYPGAGGAFFAFAPREDGTPSLCECARQAVENYLRMKEMVPRHEYSERRRTMNHLADSGQFPIAITRELMEVGTNTREEIIRHLRFRPDLCHECNGAVPSMRTGKYGGAFSRNFGWYVRKQRYEWGIYQAYLLLAEHCPAELRELFVLDREASLGTYQELMKTDPEAAEAFGKQHRQQVTRVSAAIQNAVRDKMGYRHIGKAWVQETALFQIVRRLHPEREVIHHHRAHFLGGLELDVFVPELKLALEYQGIQHFEAVEHWGGQEALEQLQARDEQKANRCRESGVALVHIGYDEPLCEEHVAAKIKEACQARDRRC